MSKYLRLNIENAGLLSNIKIIKNKNKPDTIKYDYVFKTIDNPIPEHLLLNMLTELIGEIPIPKYKEYKYTCNLEDKQKGRNILQKIIPNTFVYYYINSMNLSKFLDKEVIDKPFIGIKIKSTDENVVIYGTTKSEIETQIQSINGDIKDYYISSKVLPWYKAPWEFISGEKYQIDSNRTDLSILYTVNDFTMKVTGFYNWDIFEKNFNLTKENLEEYNKIIAHIQKIMGITVHPKLIYPKYKDLCKDLYILIKNNENIANETLNFCINNKFKTDNVNCYLYTLFGYFSKIKNKLYGKESFYSTSNIVQKKSKIRHTGIVYRVETQAMFSFDGSIIIPLDNLTNEEEEYIIQQIKNNSGITNCLEGGIARIEILEQISFNMDDYIQIFK